MALKPISQLHAGVKSREVSGRRWRRHIVGVACVAAAALAIGAAPASAVNIGQLAPAPASATCTNGPFDLVQRVTVGQQYIVPEGINNPIITSWIHQAAPGAGQTLSFKVFRKVADPPPGGGTYLQVGHDGPRPLNPGILNAFPVSIRVQAGDVIGVNDENALTVPNACLFNTSNADIHLERGGSLVDGQEGVFGVDNPGERVNVIARVEPDCDNDGLGDQTQDTNLSSCAPGTTPTGPITGPSGAPVTCKGVNATIVGTDGNDVRTASPGKDVIAGLGGSDTLSGLAGNDVICGGAGKDNLMGGKGKDSLLGQKGKDALKGGPGRDLCKGGKGTDTASKCEVEKSI
jgi:Ca2+-binding RTX toxin-like protein